MNPLRELFEGTSPSSPTASPSPAPASGSGNSGSLKRNKIILEEKDYKVIFAGIKTILTVNSELLKQIQEYCDFELSDKKPPTNLGEIFLNMVCFEKAFFFSPAFSLKS